MEKEFYGIDLGTTYSCIATIDEDKVVTVIPNPSGQLTTPSVVYFDENGKVLVGKGAKSHLASEPENTVAFVKREMSNDDYSRTIRGKKYNQVDISAEILKYMVSFANEKRVNEEGKQPLYDVVITVPAYFGDGERKRTAAAAEQAGLHLIKLINEPTSAALSYGKKQSGDKNLLVYDLGGGTFDVTILQFKNGIANVLASRGDHMLGGADWDQKLAETVLEKIRVKWDSLDDKEKNMMMIAAEDAKQSLSVDDSTTLTFNYKGIHSENVTRAEFEAATQTLLQRTKLLVEEAMSAAQLSINQIDEVIMIGGSSLMPMVKTMVSDIMGLTPKLVDPHLAVAKGAAMMAFQEETGQSVGGLMIGTDKGSRAYGTDCLNSDGIKVVENLIMMNDDQEIQRETYFLTVSDGQTATEFHFYENQSEEKYTDIESSKELEGTSQILDWGKPVPKGTRVNCVTVRDKNGCIRIFVECAGASKEFEILTPGISKRHN